MVKKISQISLDNPPLADLRGLKNAKVIVPGQFFLFENFFHHSKADKWFSVLKSEVGWAQKEIKIFGKAVAEPRLTSFQGERNVRYSYSQTQLTTQPWTPTVLEIKKPLDEALAPFNGVLLNFYRSGADSMGWHRDAEAELGPQPLIASVTLGETRDFILRNRRDHSEKLKLSLSHGSVLVMTGDSQSEWDHALPKRSGKVGERINLTFRRFIFQNLRN